MPVNEPLTNVAESDYLLHAGDIVVRHGATPTAVIEMRSRQDQMMIAPGD
jgi:hypothetical protein